MKIEACDLTVGYDAGPVIEHLALSVFPGSVITLIGANGSGKSTLLKTLARILRPSGGAVHLDGKLLTAYGNAALARKLAVLPQLNTAPEDLTVADLVGYGRFPHRRFLRGMSEHDHRVVARVIKLTHLEKLRERPVTSLSGGERQRAWLALTLAQEPEILLLDEPTTFLDVCHQFETIDLITRMNQVLGLTIVMVLHDLNLAARCSHRIVAIKDKRIFREGTPAEIITEEVLREVFNIRAQIISGTDGIPYFIPIGSCNAFHHLNLEES